MGLLGHWLAVLWAGIVAVVAFLLAVLKKVLAAVWEAQVRGFRWLLAFDLADTNDGESGFGEVLTLLGLLWAGIVALVAYVQEKPSGDWFVVGTYFGGSLVPIFAMFLLMRAEGDVKQHYFNPATVRYARLWTYLSAVIVGLVLLAYSYNALPGMAKPLSRDDVKPYDFKANTPELGIAKDDPGLAVEYPFCPTNLGINEVFGSVVLDISLKERLRGSWQIASAVGYYLTMSDDGGSQREKARVTIRSQSRTSDTLSVKWHDLRPTANCVLVVRLHPLTDTAKRDQLRASITEGHEEALNVIIHVPSQ